MSSVVKPELLEKPGAWVELSAPKMLANLVELRGHQPAATAVNAIVKANAYGHGLIPTARILENHVQYMSVTSVREMLELRAHGIRTPVLILTRLFENEIENALQPNVALMVSSVEEAQMIAAASLKKNTVTRIHIKVDTGMGRLGIPFAQALSDIEKISKIKGLDLEGLMTHFPSAEKTGGITERQVRDFSLLMQALDAKDIRFALRHAANSAGTLKIASPIFNMIRPGLMLYGAYPDHTLRDFIELEPVMTLKSRFIFIKRLQPGQSAGYGQTFTAKDPCTIGILPVGYSHGYPFKAWQEGFVLFQGKSFPFAGRISMDYMTINLGDQYARIGDEVTLIGSDGNLKVTLEDIAGWAGNIPYEVATGLSPHLPRYTLG